MVEKYSPYSNPHISFSILMADSERKTWLRKVMMPSGARWASKEFTRKSASSRMRWSRLVTS